MIQAWLINYGLITAGSAIGAVIIGWVLAKIPTGKWAKSSGAVGVRHGKAFTAFASSKIPFWNKAIEPVFIDTISVLTSYISGFIIGLKFDNPKDN